MTRVSNRLSARRVETLKEPGRYADGNGLYLRITPDGRRWTFMFTWHGKRVEVGIGSARDVSLATAREKAQAMRAMISAGQDPRDARRASATDRAEVLTFGEMADKFIASHEGGWRNDKHVDQWRYTLSRRRNAKGQLSREGYCRTLADIPVADISTADVLSVLTPIWQKKPETASRVRGRIEAVLNAAKALGYRTGENPATWRGHLSNLLPRRQKLSRGHHAAMPYKDLPALYRSLLETPTISNLALAFTIATAARSGETMGAVWSEIEGDCWRVPAERMKAGREHVVPMPDAALSILETARELKRDDNEYLFPGSRTGALSVMALTMALRRAGAGAFTVHGMRSAFRDWCGDCTAFQRDDVELCLAHQIRDETERAYRRSDALEKRRQIMAAWASYLLEEKRADVIDIRERIPA